MNTFGGASRHPATAYLSGGKYDGTVVKLTDNEWNIGGILYKDSQYARVIPTKLHNGSAVFDFAFLFQPPPTSTGPKAARLHKGWSDLQHSVNRNAPDALHAARTSRAAGLRAIARASKVRL